MCPAFEPMFSMLKTLQQLGITCCSYVMFYRSRSFNTGSACVGFRWCGPCKILGPRLEKAVAKQKGRVAMAKVDIDDHTDLAIEYGVR